MKDVVFFSIACQALWDIGRREIYRRIAASSSWAGDRILCFGHHCRIQALPKGLLTAEEQEEYPFDEITGEDGTLGRILTSPLLQSYRVSIEDYRPFRAVVNWVYALLQIESSAILRNLTRRQFFRGATLHDWRENTAVVRKETIGFNQVILSRICFSTDSSTAMGYDGNIHRGVWAGDRFDFVECGWLEGLKEDEGWVDVSDEVLKEIQAIWAAEFKHGDGIWRYGFEY
ncbi:hypothetical protein FB45DRAFT_1050718 [Roridomyces roridus]|uniref:Uncharacterized protein n=1 Tax=Roridomyces roridus TaxID=1738132 RepID=A0AAD7FZ62_9AGAR|nr:hypothetical protein FB45DRAFT_1050718 [Roridomyces roridus]